LRRLPLKLSYVRTSSLPEAETVRIACFAREAEMEKFAHTENIELYRKLLADAHKRRRLLK
jgi:putative ubiquitin-RnfH superfamily antitoxin RatB of RatAB toxin-antitoxin module